VDAEKQSRDAGPGPSEQRRMRRRHAMKSNTSPRSYDRINGTIRDATWISGQLRWLGHPNMALGIQVPTVGCGPVPIPQPHSAMQHLDHQLPLGQVAYANQRGLSGRRACALMCVARSTLNCESRLVKRDAPVVL
jgi:hypothetical protein